ncbi:MAG: dTDP-4-dehydrorhamnose 3,5-epimerase [Vicinamibacterales bacterium]|nr:dTDP-4-dehydrorhamnose 3,5-epimerase [Vicinamibacterales bacterium]
MRVRETPLQGALVIEPRVLRDTRGFFLETYHADRYAEVGVAGPFVQDNHSRSVRATLRGLHFQWRRPQGKLVRVIEGEIFDVAVDIREDTPTFCGWVAVTLSDQDFRQFYVPPGFAHGFSETSDVAQVEYKCTDLYDPEGEAGLAWNDPDLAIPWPAARPLLSPRDEAHQTLRARYGRGPAGPGVVIE